MSNEILSGCPTDFYFIYEDIFSAKAVIVALFSSSVQPVADYPVLNNVVNARKHVSLPLHQWIFSQKSPMRHYVQ